MAKKKLLIWIGSAFAVCLAYLIIAAKPITPEFSLQTKWVINVEDANSQTKAGGTLAEGPIPFVLENRYGYIAPDGTLLAKKTFQTNQFVAITPKLLSVCNPVPDTLIIESSLSNETVTVKDPSGYPYLVDEHMLLIGKNQDSVSAIGESGSLLWTYQVASPITALDCRADKLLIGTLDGTVYLLSLKGEALFTFQPGGSRLSVIFGAVLSSDGNQIALISGIDRQRFVLLERSGQTYKVAHHQFLNSDFRRPVLLKFVQNNQYVLFEGKTNLLVFDIQKKKVHEIPLQAPILAIEALPKSDTVFVMTGKESQKQLVALKLPDRKLLTAPFTSQESFMTASGDQLVVGSDSIITSYVVGK